MPCEGKRHEMISMIETVHYSASAIVQSSSPVDDIKICYNSLKLCCQINKCFSNMIRRLVMVNSIDVNGHKSFGC